ncbi:GNAT family N-acetyltransferase [Rufibacter roseus]|uniref:GNAT family N-acetyltransferase n=1 Tax=Rufibacter roseus TaxID=1567108 RepID=A0ABW2DKK6_9BACT|nr:GNAT family N-acetyltransferase [Rufibacter roseus]
MIQQRTDKVELESASAGEYEEILEVWEASVRATHHFVSEDEIHFYRPLILQQLLPQVQLTCARNEAGNMLGFSGVADGKLEMLFLHPAVRGKGIGRKLLQHAVQQQKVTKVDVNEENEQAVGFYLHEGFQVASRSPVDGMGNPHPILHLELVESKA